MKYAAFFRNVNLGHRRSPTRQQLESAFCRAGAEDAVCFQTNGTIVFTAANIMRARGHTRDACEILHEDCGLIEPAFVRSLRQLSRLADDEPFARYAVDGIAEHYVSFLPPQAAARLKPPLESRRRDVRIIRCTGGEALSLVRRTDGVVGSPNVLLEKLLQQPVTTRSWNTLLRLVKRHG